MKHGKRIARLQKRIPALGSLSSADLLALDAELGETPAKSVVTLDEAEEKAATDEATAEKRKTEGEDAELTEEERAEALKKARDKKAKDAKAAKDESEEESEEAEDESEEEEEPKKVAKDKKAKDSDPDHREDFKSEKDKKGAKDKAHDSAMTMDQVNKIVAAAVKREGAKVREEVTAKQRSLAIAVDEVSPLIGKVQLHAFDSAEEVYAFALEKVGVEIEDDFPEAGYRALVKNELRHRETGRKPVKHAQDTSANGFDADSLFQRVN
jgi:flagellar biosynthesis GTPase FlhF